VVDPPASSHTQSAGDVSTSSANECHISVCSTTHNGVLSMVSFNISENVFCADCTSTASLTAAQPVGEAAQKTFWDILNDTTDNTPCNRAARKKSKTVAHAAVVTSRPYKAKIEGESKRKKSNGYFKRLQSNSD